MTKKYNIGIAFGGGGIRGICHAGSLKALEEFSLKPDILVGCSSGAIIAALYADGYAPDDICEIVRSLNFRKCTRPSLFGGGLLTLKPFADYLSSLLHAKRLEDLSIPLRIVATDLDHSRIKVFTEGDLVSCVIASCNYPILFEPWKVYGVNYVDGGIFGLFPAKVLRDECKYLIGLNCSPLPIADYKLGIKSILIRIYNYLICANTLEDRDVCDTLIEPEEMDEYQTFDYRKLDAIYRVGYYYTRSQMNGIMASMRQKNVITTSEESVPYHRIRIA